MPFTEYTIRNFCFLTRQFHDAMQYTNAESHSQLKQVGFEL